MGQQYSTPEKIIYDRRSDVAIIGRGIYTAQDPLGATRMYRQACWSAYERRVGHP